MTTLLLDALERGPRLCLEDTKRQASSQVTCCCFRCISFCNSARFASNSSSYLQAIQVGEATDSVLLGHLEAVLNSSISWHSTRF